MANDPSSKPTSAPGDERSPRPSRALSHPAYETKALAAPLWFPAFEPHTVSPRRPNLAGLLALALVVPGILFAALVPHTVYRIVVPAILLLSAAALLKNTWKQALRHRPRKLRGLCFDGQQLWFQSPNLPASHALLNSQGHFGITLLSTPHRDRVLAMLTSALGTYCIGTRFDLNARKAFAPLLARAFTVTSDEDVLEAIGPDGLPLSLEPKHFTAMLDAIADKQRACFERIVQSDARGTPLLLDRRELRVGDRYFDLEAPLDWRGIVFQENMGQSVVVYQGTWLSQGSHEVVLVSLLPSIMSAGLSGILEGSPLSSLDRGVLRDLRLMQMSPESPPPSERRIAVDRLLMLPLRNAIDLAPRISKQRIKPAQDRG